VDEFELIARFFASARCARPRGNVALGIGDDCALLELPAGEQLAISTDTLVQGVHFPIHCDPYLLGQRALAVTASDLAGMGASAIGFTLALTLPEPDERWLDGFARGLDAMAERCALQLLGGDTTRGPLSMTLTVFGRVPSGLAIRRNGAKPGDLLCVGGSLGEAAAAVALVTGEKQAPAAIAERLLNRYWTPEPQLFLGSALRGVATAALDISDGLLADCMHIARGSGIALRIETDTIPVPGELVEWVGMQQALAFALSGGDDYRLAFTIPPAKLPALQAQWPNAVQIGCVEKGDPAIRLIDPMGVESAPSRTGYLHFGNRYD
jgi:thiamine-monophosphate kinase